MNMQAELLIAQGNQHRSDRQYEQALQCYANAFVLDRQNSNAFNNYGNVLREMGLPHDAVPFLRQAIHLDPSSTTAKFNLAVCLLLMGDYQQGWSAYESRWDYEHLAGTLPRFTQPRWTGQDIRGKTLLVLGEQGHGDNIQFCRFLINLHGMGARIVFVTTAGLVPLFKDNSGIVYWTGTGEDDIPAFDYWVPLMSVAGLLGVQIDNLIRRQNYINAPTESHKKWAAILGPKSRMRVAFCWSGRRDAWLNQHKSVPFELMLSLIQRCPQYEWINVQTDATPEETQCLADAGVNLYPGTIHSWVDTAGLLYHADIVLGVDTAISHLGGAMGRPTWVMLNSFAQDWRWLLDRNDSPWYPTITLFRQPAFHDWESVLAKVERFLALNKI